MVQISPESASVLVVDDEPTARATITAFLKRLGVREIIQAENGREAVEKLGGEAKGAQIAIIDFRMPEVHGLELLKLIRCGKTAAPRDLRCALFTGHAERRLIGLAMALDVDAFMAKPASLDTLDTHIRRLLRAKNPVAMVEAYESLEVDRPLAHLLDFAEGKAAPTSVNAKTLKYMTPKQADAEAQGDPAAPDRAAAGKSAPESSKAEQEGEMLDLSKVEEGMVLARDVRTPDGLLLLSAGTALTARYLQRLEEQEGFGQPVHKLWVQTATA